MENKLEVYRKVRKIYVSMTASLRNAKLFNTAENVHIYKVNKEILIVTDKEVMLFHCFKNKLLYENLSMKDQPLPTPPAIEHWSDSIKLELLMTCKKVVNSENVCRDVDYKHFIKFSVDCVFFYATIERTVYFFIGEIAYTFDELERELLS